MTTVILREFPEWERGSAVEFENSVNGDDYSISPIFWGFGYKLGREVKEVLKSINVNDDLDPQTTELLGADGMARYKRFQERSPIAGEASMSKMSVAVMSAFVSRLTDISFEPSLFLTSSGNLELGWEDEGGFSVSLEFYPDKIEYYLEKHEFEGEVRADNISDIQTIVSKLG